MVKKVKENTVMVITLITSELSSTTDFLMVLKDRLLVKVGIDASFPTLLSILQRKKEVQQPYQLKLKLKRPPSNQAIIAPPNPTVLDRVLVLFHNLTIPP